MRAPVGPVRPVQVKDGELMSFVNRLPGVRPMLLLPVVESSTNGGDQSVDYKGDVADTMLIFSIVYGLIAISLSHYPHEMFISFFWFLLSLTFVSLPMFSHMSCALYYRYNAYSSMFSIVSYRIEYRMSSIVPRSQHSDTQPPQ